MEGTWPEKEGKREGRVRRDGIRERRKERGREEKNVRCLVKECVSRERWK